MRLAIADASPLIGLIDTGHAHILCLAYDRILVPEEVFEEVFERRPRAVPRWIRRTRMTRPLALATFAELRLRLGLGEAAAIALGTVLDLPILVDDRKACAECNRRSVPYVRTLRLVQDLVDAGTLKRSEAALIVRGLQAVGYRLPSVSFLRQEVIG